MMMMGKPPAPHIPVDDAASTTSTTDGSSTIAFRNDPAYKRMEMELSEMRKAFEEYIATTQDLEVNLDMELQNMQGKLDESAVVYEHLSSKLKTMEPMLRSLELSLGGTKKRLKEEAKMRRTAEIAQIEAESKMQKARDENAFLQEECEALRIELEHKVKENEQLKREQDTNRQQHQEIGRRQESSIQSRRVAEEYGGASSTPLMIVDSGVLTETTSNITSQNMAGPGDAYSEVLDELETVTEQLLTTKQKLWRTEDQLRESEAKLSNLEGDTRSLKSMRQSQSKENTLLQELEQIRDEQERGVLEAASMARTLQKQAMELNERDNQIELLGDQIHELGDNVRLSQEQISELEELLEESQDENIRLVEEVASLRIILHNDVTVQDSQALIKESIAQKVREQTLEEANAVKEKEINALRESISKDVTKEALKEANVVKAKEINALRESISKEVRTQTLREANMIREKEINTLREQFKKVFRENVALKEKVEKLECRHPVSNVDNFQLQTELEKMKEELLLVREDHMNNLSEVESSWKKKLEHVLTGEFIPEDLLEEMEEEMKSAVDSAAERVRALQMDKDNLEVRVETLEREVKFSETKIHNLRERYQESEMHLESSRDESLRLKKSNTHLASELEYTTRIMSRMDAECERLTRQHAELKAELEVALLVIEESGMDIETVCTEEALKAKKEAHGLTGNLNKLKGDYSVLLSELESTRDYFLSLQEQTTKQKEAETKNLSEKIFELEEALEKERFETVEMSKQLEATRRKQKDSFVKSENNVKLELKDEMEYAKENARDLERDMTGSNPGPKALQRELKHCKDALSSSRIENTRLEEEIQKLKEEIVSNPRNRQSRDPDPVEETLACDPPFTIQRRGLEKSGDPDASSNETVLENERIRSSLVQFSVLKTHPSSGGELPRIKQQLEEKTRELLNIESKYFETKSLLRATEEKLSQVEYGAAQTKDECFELKSEVNMLKEALVDAHQIYSETAMQLEEIEGECNQLRKLVRIADAKGDSTNDLNQKVQTLAEEKLALQHQVEDSRIALSIAENSQERTKEELNVTKTKLENTQETNRVLKDDVKKLASAFYGLRNDHEALLREYQTLCKSENETSTFTTGSENFTMLLQNMAGANPNHQALVKDVEKTLLKYREVIAIKEKEIGSLEDSLLTTQKEARMLSEEITNLSAAFENAQAEYDAVVEELDAFQDLFEKSREEAYKSGKESATQELRQKMVEEKEQEKNRMKEQLERVFAENLDLQRKLDKVEFSLGEVVKKSRTTKSQRNDAGRETEYLRKALEDSQNEVKALKERCFELEILSQKITRNADQSSVTIDEHVLSAVFDSEEMQDLKNQFNALIEENINLEQIVRQSELALCLAKDMEDCHKEDVSSLEKEVSELKLAKKRLQEEMRSLNIEIERSNENQLAAVDAARVAAKAAGDTELQSLQYQVEALTMEKTSLQNKIKKMTSDATSFGQVNGELNKLEFALHGALEEKEIPDKEKTEMDTSLCAPQSNLTNDSSAREISSLQRELRNASKDISNPLKRGVDNRSSNTSFGGNQEQCNIVESKTERFLLAERDATMEIFERINSLLASVDFLERHHEINLRTSHANLTKTSQKAEEIRRKIAFLTYAFQKERKEHSDMILQWKAAKLEVVYQGLNQNETLTEQFGRLEERLLGTEAALEAATKNEQYHQVEAQIYKNKLKETQSSAVSGLERSFKDSGVVRNSSDEESRRIISEEKEFLSDSRDDDLAAFHRRLSNENKDLCNRLFETEAALSAARGIKSFYEDRLNLIESEEQIESKWKHSNRTLDHARASHQAMEEQLKLVQKKVKKSEERFFADNHKTSFQKQAELNLLKNEFEKLSKQSEELSRQLKFTEDTITNVYEHQQRLKNDTGTNAVLAKELQDEMNLIMAESKQRNLELTELMIRMESRIKLTEENMEKLEQELSDAKKKVEISRTGLLLNHWQETNSRVSELVQKRTELLYKPKRTSDSLKLDVCSKGFNQTQSENSSADAMLLGRDNRSISPFTLSLLYDNVTTESHNAAQCMNGDASITATIHSGSTTTEIHTIQSSLGRDDMKVEQSESYREDAEANHPSVETRGDCEMEQRE